MSFFKDSSGRVVIAQFPNLPIWVAVVFYAVGYLEFAAADTVSFWGVALSMLYWSYLEIRWGVNGWRRTLGLVVGFYFIFLIFHEFSR